MKKTIFNASLEESMNLVTDKYIKKLVEESKHKKLFKKVLGGLFLLLVMYLFSLIKTYAKSNGITVLFLDVDILFKIILILSTIIFLFYLITLLRLKDYSILSYYYYSICFSIIVLLLGLQMGILAIAGSALVLGNVWSTIIYGIIYLYIFIDRFVSSKKELMNTLYGNQKDYNKGFQFLEKFSAVSRKYGGFVFLAIIIFSFFKSDNFYSNGITRTIGLLGYPLVMGIGFYFVFALILDAFPGYYLQKYLEDYRQMSDYSVEEWYGKKSKKYKDSLKK